MFPRVEDESKAQVNFPYCLYLLYFLIWEDTRWKRELLYSTTQHFEAFRNVTWGFLDSTFCSTYIKKILERWPRTADCDAGIPISLSSTIQSLVGVSPR
jgi:hypothetical protein